MYSRISPGCSSGSHDNDECSDWLTLNVGGKYYSTTRTTLCAREPNSVFAAMFAISPSLSSSEAKTDYRDEEYFVWKNRRDSSGAYLIDRSPHYFEPIINYLRHGELIADKGTNLKGVLEEAKFFGLWNLVSRIEEKIELEKPPDDNTPLTRREVVKILLKTPFSANYQLRFQGVNFAGANLSHLDLRSVNFKYANLQNVNFTGANLSHCTFERAHLSNAVLDNALLLAVKMTCANLEGASMKGCNFEDPLQTVAILEGANMKNVNLDGSQMSGVNLRVSCLKNAILRNCDLKGAVLAGANLENCDLSGSDLLEANLRGANFKGATFDSMLNPLHMSQAVN